MLTPLVTGGNAREDPRVAALHPRIGWARASIAGDAGFLLVEMPTAPGTLENN